MRPPASSSSPLADFCEQVYLPPLAELTSEPNHVRVALRHFERFLQRPPRIDDLTSTTLIDFLYSLRKGRSAGTCDRYRETLIRVAREAHAAGCLPQLPRVKKMRRRWNGPTKLSPFALEELNRLFGAARCAPGEIADQPARLFWTALLFALLDIGVSQNELLPLTPDSFDRQRRTLKVGFFIFALHDRTVAALDALDKAPRGRLFPWDGDGGDDRNFEMLAYHYRYILKLARLPTGKYDLFSRVVCTGRSDDSLIDQVDLDTPFTPADLSDYHPRLRKNRKRRPGSKPKPIRQGPARSGPCAPQPAPLEAAVVRKREAPEKVVYYIDPTPERAARTLRTFFETVYVPRRLADCPPETATTYRATINRLRRFMAYDVTLDELTDDLIECFLAWMARAQYRPATRKRDRGHLLVLWRYAWRKKRVETQPRDVDEVRLPKVIPECWWIEELSKLLAVAAEVQGFVGRHPASVFWCSVILVMFDTGLRLHALMSLRTEDVDLTRRTVFARHENSKQKADQLLPIEPRTCELLTSMNLRPGERVFEWPFKGEESFRGRLRALLHKAGLKHGRRDLFHKIRRTTGTYIAIASDEETARKHLGHSTIQVTRGYLDVRKFPRTVVHTEQPDFVSPLDAGPPRLTQAPPKLLGHDPAGDAP